MLTILFISLLILISIGVPIGFAIGISTVLSLILGGEISAMLAIQRMYASVDSFPLLAVPLFMLAGTIMERGGLTTRLVNFSNAVIGFIPGGLAAVNILVSMIFGGISGAATADSAAVGSVLIPSMVKNKYSRPFAAAVTCCSSPLGIIIPPSIPLIIYGNIAGLSIGKLFLAGVFPGILVGVTLILVSTVCSIKKKYQTPERFSISKILTTGYHSFFVLIAPVIIVGGIVSGMVTATEGGVIAVLYCMICVLFIYRTVTFMELILVFQEAIIPTAVVLFIISTASGFAWIMTTQNIPEFVAENILGKISSPWLIILIITALLIFVGTFMETLAGIIMLTPILIAVPGQTSMDPLTFGIIVIATLGIGLITPPVGLCLYIASSIADVPPTAVIKEILPFALAMLCCVFLIAFFPSLTTFLPQFF